MDMLEEGLETAENELRDAVADGYEAEARASTDPEVALNDIDYTEAEDDETIPDDTALEVRYFPELSE